MKTICNECQGDNILQQVSVFVDLKDLKEPDFRLDLGGMFFDDYYHCIDCQQEVRVTEVEE